MLKLDFKNQIIIMDHLLAFVLCKVRFFIPEEISGRSGNNFFRISKKKVVFKAIFYYSLVLIIGS